MDISDFTGAHSSNIQGTLVQKHLDKDGNILSMDSPEVNKKHEHEKEFTSDDVIKSFNE